MAGIIDEKEINDTLAENANPSTEEALLAVEKARKLGGLSLKDATVLLQTRDPKATELMFSAAKEIKERIYGNRLVFFAPLYLSNTCANNCLYCAFRRDNKELKRKTLNPEEIKKEVEALLDEGHKRLLLVTGEHAETGADYLADAIQTVYSVRNGRGEIRRVNVNAAPLSLNGFKKLKECGIGTYQLFQETYHLRAYEKMHPSGGPKADYFKRLNAMELAFKAGIDDLGIGALFGLYDYRFETLALLAHAMRLEERCGVGPHTISVPRIETAMNAPAALKPPSRVTDEEFKKLVAVLRLAVPYTGIILSTRESPELRDEVFSLGVSQISAGSRTNPGGYSGENAFDESQFALHDNRTTAEVVRDVCLLGFTPSFCTACYRSKRTGDRFMNLAKTGRIQNFCLPNALLTFKEYLEDYGKDKALGEKVVERELEKISDANRREQTRLKLKRISEGERNLYF